MIDTSTRTLAKTISWRVIATITTYAVSYFISGDTLVASSIAGSQILINTTLYMIHERIWNKVSWGKRAH